LSQNLLPKKYKQYLGLGAEIAASLFIPIITGYYLDEYFDTSPFLVLAGILLAIIIFGFTIVRISKNIDEDEVGKS
jgi:F0F1-type ATP synthase assembly protein I